MAKSAFGQLVGLVVVVILIAIVGAVGFVAYSIACDVANNTGKKMEKKNISVGKGGMKVGVKHKSEEQVGDKTQSLLVNAWNASSWPAYKSKLGWGQGTQTRSAATTPGVGTEKRKPYSRGDSSQSTAST